MSGGLDSIISTQLESAKKADANLAKAMSTKKIADCVSAIYKAFESIARKGGNSVALSGDDALIGSAAIHWYTESNPTQESIVAILKGGTTVKSMKAESKKVETAPVKQPETKKDIKPAPAPKVVPMKLPPKPSPAPIQSDSFTVDEDDLW